MTAAARPEGNWGRWGEDDERGALNLLDETTVSAALAQPRAGRVYQLGQPIQMAGVPMGPPRRPRPLHVFFRDGGDFEAGEPLEEGKGSAEDYLGLPTHGVATHIDALGHVFIGDRIYNGFPRSSVRSSGLGHCGIDRAGPLVTRGVVLDVPRARGVEMLEGGYAVTADDVRAALAATGTSLRPGDAVLLRTGWPLMFERDPEAYAASSPGLGMEAAALLCDADVSLVGADNIAVEPYPFRPGESAPVHQLLLVRHGIYLVELLALEELTADGVAECLLVVAPLLLSGGTGSPVNPVAIV
jgi:kynurenine formamidase